MGRASRAKQDRGPRRSRADLLALLDEQLGFLRLSAKAFDEGVEAEAKRLAMVLRVLLHDTRLSKSLLGQLKVQDRLMFLDTAEPINPNNALPTPGLVTMLATATGDGGDLQYIAPLEMERASGPAQKIPFAGWWNNPVMKVDGTWSRHSLVVRSLANREGGGHVDPHLDERYEAIAKHNAVGWTALSAGSEEPARGDVVAAAVRQISYEVLESLTDSPLLDIAGDPAERAAH